MRLRRSPYLDRRPIATGAPFALAVPQHDELLRIRRKGRGKSQLDLLMDILSARDTDQLPDALRSLPIWLPIALAVNPVWRLIHSLRKPALCPDPVLRIHVCGIHQGWPRQLA